MLGYPISQVEAVNLFVAIAVFSMAATLLLAGRRSPEGLLLAVFLGLVGVNFLADALSLAGRPLDAPDLSWRRVAYAALALDPIYLLAFVTAFPYRRRSRRVRVLLVAVATMGAVSVASTVFGGARILSPSTPEHVLLVAELAVAYIAAWMLAVRAAGEAPTPLLARRASWMAAAVGVAVVPRMGLLPQDVSFQANLEPLGGLSVVAELALSGALILGVFLVGAREARRGAAIPDLRRALLLVGVLSAFVFALQVLASGLYFFVPGVPRLTIPYGVRWIVFSGILVYSMLAFEVVEFERASTRAMPALGAWLGAAAAVMVTLAYAGAAGLAEAVAWPLALAAGLGAAVPSGFLTLAAARRLQDSVNPPRATERRLSLYRAALETAWVAGPPSPEARARLEEDRKAFHVSYEEARGLEHAVAARGASRAPRLLPGDEPATGLVLGEVLGEGAHGRVFRARRYPTGEAVVVKEFHPADGDPEVATRRLLAELRALEGLRHPAIVPVLEAEVTGGRSFLVMAHVEGRPLADLLQGGKRLPPPRLRVVLEDVLDALETAHARGVVHRDVKPSNILVGADGRAHLTDFGMAAMTDGHGSVQATVSNLDALGALQGTLAYMAPEQAAGGAVGPAADLYAVGLVAYEALAGRPALDLEGCAILDAIQRVARPHVDLQEVPPAWRGFLVKALAVDPAERFADAATMRLMVPARD